MPNGIVFIKDNQTVVTTSLKVAEYFEKRHDHLLRDIKEIISTLKTVNYEESAPKQLPPKSGDKPSQRAFVERHFISGKYVAENGKRNPMFFITRDGFILLAGRLTGVKATRFQLDFIREFNRRGEELDRLLAEKYDAKRKAQHERYLDQYHFSMNTVKSLILHSVKEGYSRDSVDPKFYRYINHAINEAVGIEDGSRPIADSVEYYRLREVHSAVKNTIANGIRAKLPAQTIYQFVLERICDFGNMFRLASADETRALDDGGKDFFLKRERPSRDPDYEFEPDAYDDDNLPF